jgi:F1F0 ATPase subunit 2
MSFVDLNIVHVIAFLGGGMLAVLHQWGLRWTVDRMRRHEQAELWLFMSFTLRMMILLAVLAAIAMTGPGNLFSFGIGLIVARLAMTGWLIATRPPRQTKAAP